MNNECDWGVPMGTVKSGFLSVPIGSVYVYGRYRPALPLGIFQFDSEEGFVFLNTLSTSEIVRHDVEQSRP